MNGPHDLGGKHGFGAIAPEIDEPVFHAHWEQRMFGITLALDKHIPWTLDEDRHTCENQHPQIYLTQSYYETWLQTMEKLLVRHKVLAAGDVAEPGMKVNDVAVVLANRAGYDRTVSNAAVFKIGDRVRMKNLQPAGHTRLPSYLRGHLGQVLGIHGAHVFPDSNAHGKGETPQWLYSIRFSAADIWGRPSVDVIYADMWEPYLERA